MARIRTIKPMFWTDETMVELPYEYRLLFIGLWNFADDEGFIENKPHQIKLQVFPGDDVDVKAGIRALVRSHSLEALTLNIDGTPTRVLRIKGWKNHQVISRPTPSKYAEEYAIYQGKRSTHGGLTEDSRRTPSGRERKGKEGKGDTQVGGGGNPSSGEPQQPPPPISGYEPWRCAKHQGVDVKCYDCKAAKTDFKESEAQRAREKKLEKGNESKRTHADRKEADRLEAERVAAEIAANPDALDTAKAKALEATKRARLSA